MFNIEEALPLTLALTLKGNRPAFWSGPSSGHHDHRLYSPQIRSNRGEPFFVIPIHRLTLHWGGRSLNLGCLGKPQLGLIRSHFLATSPALYGERSQEKTPSRLQRRRFNSQEAHSLRRGSFTPRRLLHSKDAHSKF